MSPGKRLFFLCLSASLIGLALVGTACAPESLEAGTITASAPAEPSPVAWTERPAVAGVAPTHSYSPEQVERGRKLVAIGLCTDCHTPVRFDPVAGGPVPDMTRFLSGHPEGAPTPQGSLGPEDTALIGPTFTSFRLPFGTVYTMNLTPDIDTGTGSWTEEMFVNIFRRGKHLGGEGRPVLPPMPWANVSAALTDEELMAIFAYLRSLPPVRNLVPSPEVPDEAIWAIDAANQAMLGRD